MFPVTVLVKPDVKGIADMSPIAVKVGQVVERSLAGPIDQDGKPMNIPDAQWLIPADTPELAFALVPSTPTAAAKLRVTGKLAWSGPVPLDNK